MYVFQTVFECGPECPMPGLYPKRREMVKAMGEAWDPPQGRVVRDDKIRMEME